MRPTVQLGPQEKSTQLRCLLKRALPLPTVAHESWRYFPTSCEAVPDMTNGGVSLSRELTTDKSCCSINLISMPMNAPILVFPHHGGRPGTCNPAKFVKDICAAVGPETVIFSVDRTKYELPRDDVVQAVRACCAGVRIACTQLSDQCANVVPADNPAHLVDVYAHGKESKCCCAGTIVISLADSTVTPSRADHDGFKTASAPTAMCMKSSPLSDTGGPLVAVQLP